MKLAAKLALLQLINSPRHTLWSLIGIVLSVAMLVAVSSFGVSGAAVINDAFYNLYHELTDNLNANIIMSFTFVLGGVIVATSVVVISNSFHISARERIKQFGIIKSVGGVKRQITATVMCEGIFLSMIGIPLGILFGFLINFIAVIVANFIIIDAPFNLIFSVSPLFLSISVVLSAFVILFSAWLPAKRVAKISAIDAIKGVSIMNTKQKKKSKKILFIGHFFGFEGILAAKQMKHNRRRFRATMITICFSVVLILFSAGLHTHLMLTLEGRNAQLGLNIEEASFGVGVNFMTHAPTASYFDATVARQILDELRSFPNTDVIGRGMSQFSLLGSEFNIFEHRLEDITVLMTIDYERYKILAERAGVDTNSNIFINVALEMDANLNFTQINPFDDATGQSLTLYQLFMIPDEDGFMGIRTEVEVTPHIITIDAQITHLPDSFLTLADFPGAIVVPNMNVTSYQWIGYTDNPTGFIDHAVNVFHQNMILQDGEIFATVNSVEEIALLISFYTFLAVFVSIFSAIIILFSLTNIISTVLMSIQLRTKELVTLISVGMDKTSITRMLSLESVLTSTRALVIGIPLGLGAAFIAHQAVQIGLVGGAFFRFSFVVPVLPIVICVVGIYIVTFAIAQFAAAYISRSNIIESVRAAD